MRIESKLCHISENRVVVQVSGWLNEKNLGSSMAEGITVEIAEDKAILRLNKRLNMNSIKEENIDLTNQNKLNNKVKLELPSKEKLKTTNFSQEPTDWSNELIAIDAEIQRLSWSREDEIRFLNKTLGFNNRNKITKYSDLVNYLSKLKELKKLNLSEESNKSSKILIDESDILLRDLSWDNKKGREFLQNEFNVSTRMELDEEQLRSFVEKLMAIKNQYL